MQMQQKQHSNGLFGSSLRSGGWYGGPRLLRGQGQCSLRAAATGVAASLLLCSSSSSWLVLQLRAHRLQAKCEVGNR